MTLKKHAIAKLGVLVAAPMMVLAGTVPAHASENYVTWQDWATSGCLTTDTGGIVGTDAKAVWHCGSGNTYDSSWFESQDNLDTPDGAYTLKDSSGQCLTAWYPDQSTGVGSVYVENCSSPANWYEQWYEQWDGSHWHLQNRQTKAYLDSNSNGDVYVMYWNGGRNQAWS